MKQSPLKKDKGFEIPVRVFQLREARIQQMLAMNEVDQSRTWIPEEFTVAHYLPSYHRLSRKRQVELNQLYALKFCESTIFLESWIEVCLLQNKNRNLLTEDEISRFVEEEREHTRWFARLLALSHSEKYPKPGSYWLLPSFLPSLTHWVGRFASLDIFWLFLGLYFEERFLTLNRLIHDDSNVDQLHRAVHSAHVVDEASHVRDDTKALRRALARSSGLKKWLNAKIISMAMNLIFRNIRFGSSVWKFLNQLTVEEEKIVAQMKVELRHFITTSDYASLVFSKKWNPIASSVVKSEPSLAPILKEISE